MHYYFFSPLASVNGSKLSRQGFFLLVEILFLSLLFTFCSSIFKTISKLSRSSILVNWSFKTFYSSFSSLAYMSLFLIKSSSESKLKSRLTGYFYLFKILPLSSKNIIFSKIIIF